MILSAQDANKLGVFLQTQKLRGANGWMELKKVIRSAPSYDVCRQFQKNEDVLSFLAEAEADVAMSTSADLWNRTYTVTLKSGEKSIKYTY